MDDQDLQDFQKKLKFIRQGLEKKESVSQKLNQLEKELDKKGTETTSLKSTLSEVRVSLYKLSKEMKFLKTNLKALEDKASGLKNLRSMATVSDIRELSQDLRSLEKDVNRLKDLPQRMEHLEENFSGLSTLEKKTRELEEKTSGLTTDINSLDEETFSLEDRLANITDRFTHLRGRVRGLADEDDLKEVSNKTDRLEENLQEMEEDNTALEDRITKAQSGMKDKLVRLTQRINHLKQSLRDLADEDRVEEIAQEVTGIKNSIQGLEQRKQSLEDKIRKQKISLTDRLSQLSNTFVTEDDLDPVKQKLDQVRGDVLASKKLERNLKEVEDKVRKKTDLEHFRNLQKLVHKQNETLEDLLNRSQGFLRRKEVENALQKISELNDKVKDIRNRLKYNEKMIEKESSSYRDYREQLREITKEQDREIENMRTELNEKLKEISQTDSKFQKALRDFKTLKREMVLPQDFLQLKERVYEIEESLKELEIEKFKSKESESIGKKSPKERKPKRKNS